MRLAGIDGCRAGWIMASSDKGLTSIQYSIVGTAAIGQVIESLAAESSIAAIDIPIGLAEREPRACDLAARRYLKPPRASGVFPAPCRAALPARSYLEACELNRYACGRGLSVQTFGILDRIKQVDMAMSPKLQKYVRESHPEVVFARLHGRGHGLAESKKSQEGHRTRQYLLEARLHTRLEIDAIRHQLGRSSLAVDDLLDALACLVAAQNIAENSALVLPPGEIERDQRGLRMEIVA